MPFTTAEVDKMSQGRKEFWLWVNHAEHDAVRKATLAENTAASLGG